MESLSPFLWRTCTSYNMPVYPGARRVVGHSVQYFPVGGEPPATLEKSRMQILFGHICRKSISPGKGHSESSRGCVSVEFAKIARENVTGLCLTHRVRPGEAELMNYRSSALFIEIGFGVLSDEWAPLSFAQTANSSRARSRIPSFR